MSEKLPEPNIPQGTDTPLSPEQEKGRIVPVEELIPDIKPETEVAGKSYGSNHFDNNFMPEFLKAVSDFTCNPETLEILRRRFKDQILVDLGPGTSRGGYDVAVALGCKGYVAVERFWHQQLTEGSRSEYETLDRVDALYKKYHFFQTRKGNIKPEIHLIPASVAAEDMLTFLRRLPDNSVSVLTSGIDTTILVNTEHRREIAKELQRVLSEKGMYMTCASDISTEGLEWLPEKLKKEGVGEDTEKRFRTGWRIGLFVKGDKQKQEATA